MKPANGGSSVGVSRAASREDFGEARLQDVTKDVGDMSAQAIVEKIIGAVRTFAKGAPQSDDITAMVVRYRGAGQ